MNRVFASLARHKNILVVAIAIIALASYLSPLNQVFSTVAAASNNRPSDNPSSDNRPSDNPSSDNRPSDNPSSDNRPSDNPSSDNRPSDKPPENANNCHVAKYKVFCTPNGNAR